MICRPKAKYRFSPKDFETICLHPHHGNLDGIDLVLRTLKLSFKTDYENILDKYRFSPKDFETNLKTTKQL